MRERELNEGKKKEQKPFVRTVASKSTNPSKERKLLTIFNNIATRITKNKKTHLAQEN